MVDTATTKAVPAAAAHASRQGYWRGVLRRLLRDPGGVVVGVVILLLLALALFGPWLIVKDPYQTSMFLRLKPIGSDGFPLGSDELGRDMLSRLILGTRLSLFMGIVPVVFAFFIGGAIGIIAGYTGGKTNTVIMRTVDVFYAFPSVLLAIALSGALGAGIGNALLSLTLVFVPQVARIAESVTAQVRHMDYIDAARATGASALTIIRVQVLGNVLGPIFVLHRADFGVHDPRLRPVVSRPRRAAAGARVGADAQYAAHGNLYPAVGGRPAGPDDFYHLHFVQYPRGPPACGNGD